MLVSDVITQVRATAGDISALQFTDAQIVAWINNGIRECAQDNNLLQKRGTVAGVIGQSDYPLASNFSDMIKVHSIKYNDQKLEFITLEEFDKIYSGVGADTTTQRGVPQVAYIWAGILTIYPAPSEVHNLVVDYLKDAAQHTVGALNVELNLPVIYHMRIVDYCLAQVAQQDQDVNLYNIKMTEFRTGVQSAKDVSENSADLYPFMSVSERDMGSGAEIFEW